MLRTLLNTKDVLNIFHIVNEAFLERAKVVFNPRNAMYISKINGKLNPDMIVQRDTIINTNTFLWLGRHNYSSETLAKINKIKNKQKAYYMDDDKYINGNFKIVS